VQTRGSWFVSQVWPAVVQSLQEDPPEPQRLFKKPAWHVLPWQQPGQVAGPQGAWQAPPLQTCAVGVQSAQVEPPLPHALSCVPVRHVLPRQQPVGQLVALQPSTQAPA
jgi:hypothetical protein